MSLFSELKRRNVFRVGIAYLVTAWLVAQVAELAFDSFGAPDWVMKTLIFLMAIGLPFALIFAWAFEMTPDGIKRERDVDRSRSITRETGRKLNFTIIGMLVVALIISIGTHRWMPGGPASNDSPVAALSSEKSIAFLPFVNMSDDPSNEYFSDGISEELLNVLVKIEGLRVASRTSSFSFKDKDISIPEIADALNVEHVLEGSVRKAGDTVRVTAQLIDVKTDSHLWSETYDRKLEDIFVIQDEISAHIVDALKVALGAGEIVQTTDHSTENLSAFEDYLRGRHFWSRRGEENIRKAIELFERATEADPAFARAWSSLSAAHLTLPTYSLTESAEKHRILARQYAQKALALDPSLAEAHAVLGDLARVQHDWPRAESHYLQAIQLEPNNSTGYLWYAEHLGSVGRLQASLDNALKAVELDPFNAGANSVLGYAYEANGDFDNAVKYTRAAVDLGHPWAVYDLVFLSVANGDDAAAERIFESEIAASNAEFAEAFPIYLAALRDPGAIEAWFDWQAQNLDENPLDRIMDSIQFGRIDEAVTLLGEIELIGNDWMGFWLPFAEPLRRHPAFADLLKRYDLVAYWDESGWPESCRREGETITCR